MHGLGQQAVITQIEHRIQRAAEGQQPALPVRRDSARNDQTDSTLRTLAEIGRQLRVIPETVLHAGVHRTHHHAVAQTGEAEVELGE
jgi:hypothetical protein